MIARDKHIAILLSFKCFEDFYRDTLGLTCESYISSYRNDFSFSYGAALAAVGVDVTIYMPSWTCQGVHRLEDGISARFLPLAQWYGIWQRNPILTRTPVGRYISEVANTIAFEGALKRALIDDSINVLYVQEYWTGRFDYLATVPYIPVIGSDHGGRRFRQLTFRKRKSFASAHAITSQTADECRQVRSFGTEPEFLPNGVDTTFYSPTDAIRSKMILMVARLENEQKRITDALLALKQMSPDWRLLIAGSGRDEEMLRKKTIELGIDRRVEFLGFVNDKIRLRQLFRECGVFCMPSAYEAVTLAVLEAMSCDCAVVVSKIRAFEPLIDDGVNGFKVPVEDPAALANAIDRAWEARERIGKAARETVLARHSDRQVALRLKSIIASASR